MIEIFDSDAESPELIWSSDMRNQLRLKLTQLLDRILSTDRDPAMQYVLPPDADVVYKALENELFVGGVYVSRYLKEPTFNLRDPTSFLEHLLQRWTKEMENVLQLPSTSQVVTDEKALVQSGEQDDVTSLTTAAVFVCKLRPTLCERLGEWGYMNRFVYLLNLAITKQLLGAPVVSAVRLLHVGFSSLANVEAVSLVGEGNHEQGVVRSILHSINGSPLHKDCGFMIDTLFRLYDTGLGAVDRVQHIRGPSFPVGPVMVAPSPSSGSGPVRKRVEVGDDPLAMMNAPVQGAPAEHPLNAPAPTPVPAASNSGMGYSAYTSPQSSFPGVRGYTNNFQQQAGGSAMSNSQSSQFSQMQSALTQSQGHQQMYQPSMQYQNQYQQGSSGSHSLQHAQSQVQGQFVKGTNQGRMPYPRQQHSVSRLYGQQVPQQPVQQTPLGNTGQAPGIAYMSHPNQTIPNSQQSNQPPLQQNRFQPQLQHPNRFQAPQMPQQQPLQSQQPLLSQPSSLQPQQQLSQQQSVPQRQQFQHQQAFQQQQQVQQQQPLAQHQYFQAQQQIPNQSSQQMIQPGAQQVSQQASTIPQGTAQQPMFQQGGMQQLPMVETVTESIETQQYTPKATVGSGVDARSAVNPQIVAEQQAQTADAAPGAAQGRVSLLTQALKCNLCEFMINSVLENPGLKETRDPASAQVHAVALLKLLCKDPGYGPKFKLELSAIPAWSKYKSQDHSMMTADGKSSQRADYFLTDGGSKDVKLLTANSND